MSSATPRTALAGRLLRLLWGCILCGSALYGCASSRVCTTERCRSDAQITAAVLARFDLEPELLPPSILRVSTYHRVVFLAGQVATPYQQEIAADAAQQVAGVSRVVNSIAVTYAGR